MKSLNWSGRQGLVLNSNFGRVIFHIMFYRNVISFNVNHNFSSAYSALSENFGGHFWANNLLRTYRVIKVTIPTYVHFKLGKGLRSHSLYNCAGYILSYMNIVYDPRNIPVQVWMNVDFSYNLLSIEHCSVKEILLRGLYNSWKTLALLCGPSTVNPVCHDAAYESCGPLSYAPRTDQHPTCEPAIQAQCWLSSMLYYKNGSLANGTNHSRRMSLIV